MKKFKKVIFVLLIMTICICLNTRESYALTTLNCSTTLKKGIKGEQVKILQTELNTVMSCGLDVDGSFGSDTQSCVVKFQAKYNLAQDGKVGPKTCPKVNEVYSNAISNKEEEKGETTLKITATTTLKKDSNGTQVKILQQMLNKTTHCNLESDGDFGNQTEWCVKKYQEEHNLDVDGKVGPATRNSLNSYEPVVKKEEFITITASSTLNVREDATTNSQKIGSVKGKEVYQILGSKTNSDGTTWYKIEYQTNKFGYISGNYTAKAEDFILLDISAQNLKLYKKGEVILNVPVVTGNKSKGWDTPTGKYSIGYMNDYIKNGDRIYLSKYGAKVDYWMSFDGNYGFHDADWRSSSQLTNQKTYLTDGSHGCVNMFMADAKFLYENISKGLSVSVVEKVYY